MIEIPVCLYCKNCKKDMKCEAYPDGIPTEVMYEQKEEHEICNNGVMFEKI